MPFVFTAFLPWFLVSGLITLGVSGPLVLSFIVFLCSFVPVVGVFISTLPMAAAALSDYGMSKVRAVFAVFALLAICTTENCMK